MREPNILDLLVIFFGTINLFRLSFLLISSDFYSLRKHILHKYQKSPIRQPSFSVIIPAHNEEKTIQRAIDSILGNNYPKDKLEICIVDDGSVDSTTTIVNNLISKNNFNNIKLISQPNSGKAAALNNGILNHSSGELVMCLDSDSTLDPNALAKSARYFLDPTIQGLCANVKIIPENTLLNLIQRFEYLIGYQIKRAHNTHNMEYILGGVGSVFRRKILLKVGLYDTDTVTEDIDLTMKVLSLGNKKFRVIYAADVLAYTEGVLNLKDLIRQRHRWKWGRFQTFYKNKSMFLNPRRKFSKSLTFYQLPMAIYGELAFIFEPLIISYIFYLTFYYQDWRTLLFAWISITFYLVINILAEDTLDSHHRFRFVLFAPLMYFLLYIISFIEYVALIKSLLSLPRLRHSITKHSNSWQHVQRSGQTNLIIQAQ